MMKILETGGIPCFYIPASNAWNPGGYYETPSTMGGDFSEVPDGYAVKCLPMLSAYAPLDTDARVIIMRRDYGATLRSVNRLRVERFKEEPYDPEQWGPTFAERQHAHIRALREWCADKPHIQVWYEDLLSHTPDEIRIVAKFLGLPLDNRLADMANVVKGRSY